jgi:hypothetical protein
MKSENKYIISDNDRRCNVYSSLSTEKNVCGKNFSTGSYCVKKVSTKAVNKKNLSEIIHNRK